jgi:hypothetical protein
MTIRHVRLFLYQIIIFLFKKKQIGQAHETKITKASLFFLKKNFKQERLEWFFFF